MTLADASEWYLPRIDAGLVYTTSGLQADFLEAFRLAQQTRETEGFSPELVRYQLHLIQLGQCLLDLNYDARDDEWKQLLQFDRLVDAFLFTRAVGTALSDSRGVWGSKPDSEGGRGFSPN